MKTEHVLEVKVTGKVIHALMKEGVICGSDLVVAGNNLRARRGLPLVRLVDWLKMTSTKEFIDVVRREVGADVITTKRGRSGGTYLHPILALDLAAWLHPELKFVIYKEFIEGRLLRYRELGGDEYITLIETLFKFGEKVLGKPAHKGHYINLAKIIRERLGVENWNTATSEQQRERMRIERELVKLIELDLVRDWDHLKELAKKV